MSKNLVIVESPSKGRTISRFLGSNFIVESSFGHIRDLPSSKLGVDVEKNFEPQYVIPRKASAAVKKLKQLAVSTDKTILATDEDREGEAIAWHLVQALGLNQELRTENLELNKLKDKPKSKPVPAKKIERIVFHEITQKAITEALQNPREIDMRLVDSQQARRVLDRLVGYKLSPFLWKKIYRGLSAGRVQSVAVRLIAEREKEIQNFKVEEYWSISAILQKSQNPNFHPPAGGQIPNELQATLIKIGDKTLDKFEIKNAEGAEKIVNGLESARWVVDKIEKRAVAKNPPPPLTTSTLQQEAFRKLGFSAKQTMVLAQQLYEGMELGEGPVGLITYMRTDSFNLSSESLQAGRDFLKKEVGEKYTIPSPRQFQTKTKGAQEAHEAIRPTDPWRTPDSIKNFLEPRQYRLYDLIWRRFLATQMPAAIFDSTTVDIVATNSQPPITNYLFRANGQIMKFDGFLKIYPLKFGEVELPPLEPEEKLDLKELKPNQHFTEPPPRYTEATLIKTLEKYGIGRPSTYAPTISTIQDRGYVEKYDRRTLKPTETGFLVNNLLLEHFPEIVDIQFTAKMEKELDEIAEGKIKWQDVIREFYEPFNQHLEEKYNTVKKHEIKDTTEETCGKCGKPMVVKLGRFGKFLACSGFPECKNTKSLKTEPTTIGMKCPKCQEGDIIIKRTKRKKIFFGCSRYPECDYASWTDPRKEKKES